MKKLSSITLSVLMLFNFTSCNAVPYYNDTKSLGRPVSSLTYQTNNGETLTIDENSYFYSVIKKLACNFSTIQINSKVHGRFELEEHKVSSSINIYSDGRSSYSEIESIVDGYDSTVKIKTYHSASKLNLINYRYKTKEHIYGVEYSSAYEESFSYYPPVFNQDPRDINSEFWKVCNTSISSLNKFDMLTLSLFSDVATFNSLGQEHDYSSYIKTELELHENYIIFKQESPFIDETSYEQVEQNIASGTIYKQVAHFNLNTRKIDYIQIQRSIVDNETVFEEVKDYSFYHIETLDKNEYDKKVNKLVNYVKCRSSAIYYIVIFTVPLLVLIALIILFIKHKKKRKNQINNDDTPVKQSSIY